MKKIIPILALCVLLSGCGDKGFAVEEVQSQYERITTAEMEAEVTLCGERESMLFLLNCRYCAAGKTEVSLLEPEELAGITATVEGEDFTVSYGGMILPAGSLESVCPANVLPCLLQVIGHGYVTGYGRETIDDVECLSISLDSVTAEGETYSCRAWLDSDTLIPRYAEIADENGNKVLSVRMCSFSCTLADS